MQKKVVFFYSQTKIDLATAKSFCSTKFCYCLTQRKEGVFFYLILKTVLLNSSDQLLQAADELNHTSQSNFDRRLTGEKATYCAVYVPLGFSCLIFFLDCAHWLLSCRSLDPIRIGLNLLIQRCKVWLWSHHQNVAKTSQLLECSVYSIKNIMIQRHLQHLLTFYKEFIAFLYLKCYEFN